MSGSKQATKYLLDSNPFIEAKNRYYGFEICPGFWKAILDQHGKGRVESIMPVCDELMAQSDELSDWVKEKCPKGFFKKVEDQAVIDQLQQMIGWVFSQPFTQAAQTEFASVADGFVIAYAAANGLTVVTHEEYAPDAKKKVPMPNVCLEFDVPYINTFDMLADLGVQLDLKTKRRR